MFLNRKGLHMKLHCSHFIHLLLILLLLSTFQVAIARQSDNALDNPSFEKYNEETLLPEAWGIMKLHSLDEHHQVDRNVARSGKASAMISNPNLDLDIKSYLLFIQRNLQEKLRKYKPGTEMEFSAYVMGDSPDTRFRIYCETREAERAGNCFASPVKAAKVGEWEKVSVFFKMPELPSSFYVCLQLVNVGTLWFDDAYLGPANKIDINENIKAETSQNRIVNPSMEQLDPEGKMPLGWNTHQANKEGEFFSLDKKNARTAHNSIRISSAVPLKTSDFVMWQQTKLQERLKDCPPGTPMMLSFWANNSSNPSVKFRSYVEMRAKGKFIGTFTSPSQSSYFGWKQFFLEFEMPEEVPDSAYLCLQLLSIGTVWFDDVWLGKAIDAPVKPEAFNEENEAFCRVVDFPPQQTWYYPERPEKLSLQWLIPKRADGRLQVTLTDLAGTSLKEYFFEDKESKGGAEILLPELDQGVYLLQYKADFLNEEDIFRIIKKPARGVRFTSDNRMIFNGKPFFPLNVVTPDMTEKAMQVYKEAGFNTVSFNSLTANRGAGKYIGEVAAKYDLAVISWSNFPDSKLNDQDFAKMISENIQNARQLKNFIGWLSDESEMREIPLSAMKRTYRAIYSNAPEFVVWENHAPRMTESKNVLYSMPNIRRFTRQSDVSGCDIYPVPEGGGHSNLENRTISCVGEYTDMSRQAAYEQKPVWMILQAGAWGEYGLGSGVNRGRPTYEQYRFMFYNAITHGASGIVMFGQGVRDLNSPFMAMMADVNHEFKAIESFFTLGDPSQPQVEGNPHPVRIVQRSHGDEWLLVAVNESKKTQRINVHRPAQKTFHLLPAGEAFQPENKKLTLELAANEVVILSTIKSVIPKHGLFKGSSRLKDDDEIERDGGALQKIEWAAQWVAHPDFYRTPDCTTYAIHKFNLAFSPKKAFIRLTADDQYRLSVNGEFIGGGRNHSIVQQYNITNYLQQGANEIQFDIYNIAGPNGLIYEGKAGNADHTFNFASGSQTRFSKNKKDWDAPYLGGSPPVAPWGNLTILFVHKDDI